MDIFEFQELELKDREDMREVYGAFDITGGYVCFGPNKYLLPIGYRIWGPILKNQEVRKDDIWIGGFSRSGTHWLAELTWLIGNNLDFEKSRKIHHDERIVFYDFHEEFLKTEANSNFPTDPEAAKRIYTTLPSPRYFKTHFPLSYLPSNLLDTAKMVYIARDPRDVLISCFNFYRKHKYVNFLGDLKTMWKQFKKGIFVYGPYFENVLEFWKQRDNENILFLFYEELHKDLPASIKRVAQFLGHHYTEDQIHSLSEYLNFTNMKDQKSVNHDILLGTDSQQVVRKGETGGWREEFDDEMAQEAEAWIAEKLQGTDYMYPHMKLN